MEDSGRGAEQEASVALLRHGRLLPEPNQRLAEVAISYAVGFVVAGSLTTYAHGTLTQGGGKGIGLTAGAIAVVGAIVLAIISRRRLIHPTVARRISPYFLVLGTLFIYFAELWHSDLAGGVWLGISWACLWIVVYPFVGPTFMRPSPLPALLAAATGPVVLAGVVGVGMRSMPEPSGLALLFVPTFLAAALSLFPARSVLKMREFDRLGAYHLVECIGRGGMGEVWRAQHRILVRPAAIKLIHSLDETQNPGQRAEVVRRFRLEAQATSELRSPHTVSLFDFGIAEDGRFFYVMELLDGLDMHTLVERIGPIQPARAVHLMQQACLSLAEAHQHGLVHRDVKPANLQVCRVGVETDFVKVLDFGLVKAEPFGGALDQLGGDGRLTAPGALTGTPAFLAPEVAAGLEADPRTDLYGLGCITYWLLTGRLVFDGDTATEMAQAHLSAIPQPPSAFSEFEISPELDRIVLACLSKRREDRPPDAMRLEALFADCEVGEPWTPRRARRWWDQHLPDQGGYQSSGDGE